MPMSRLLAGTLVTSTPPTDTVPDVASSRPARIRSAVVLPQPDGPEQRHQFAGLDVQGQTVERFGAAVHPGQVAQFDGDAGALRLTRLLPVRCRGRGCVVRG